jgi:predicted hydrolase (HD superfamily)
MIAMTSASACTAQTNKAQNDVAFLCSVDGAKLLDPAMSSENVCALFKTKIDDALSRKTIAVNSVSDAVPADWIKLNVRFSQLGTASAMVVQRTEGNETAHPEIAVDVMDKAMGPNDVVTLASAVAKFLSETIKD